MTLAFWLGFAVGTLMWLAVTVLAAIRVAGMCSEEERQEDWERLRQEMSRYRQAPHNPRLN